MPAFQSAYDSEFASSVQDAVDVIVIGSGFAGLAAALTARRNGASVRVIEMMKGLGGNSVISDGVIAAAGTSYQQRQGVDDSPERMLQDMLRAGRGLSHEPLTRAVAFGSAQAFEWLLGLGVQFRQTVERSGGHSAARGHVAGEHAGAAILHPLLKRCREADVELATRTILDNFLVNEHGRVVGVEVRTGYDYRQPDSGALHRIGASKAVILASGGYGADVAFRSVQDPRLGASVDTTNRPFGTAHGLVAAMRLGAAPVQLSRIQLGPWGCPDEKGYGAGPGFASYAAFPFGLVVDPATGERFMNELADRKTRSDAILALGHPAVGIADDSAFQAAGYDPAKALKRGVVRRYENAEELAAGFSMPPQALTATLERFARAVEQGEDKEFGKPILDGATSPRPPFYAMRLWPKVHFTMGGIRVDQEARVLDMNGRPIAGLFAAGEVVGGTHGDSRLGSSAIAECIVFGRIAGRNAGS